MGKARERQIILKTDQRNIFLELSLGGKLQAKSSGCDENRMFFEGTLLKLQYPTAAWERTHVPAGPRPAPPLTQHYFPTKE
jgi:hypothetical protein